VREKDGGREGLREFMEFREFREIGEFGRSVVGPKPSSG
jgi:hypothetical protein